MSDSPVRPMSDDDRDDLASMAEASGRRNRPTWMIVGGGLLLLVMLVWLVLSVRAVGANESRANRAANQLESIQTLAAELQTLEQIAAARGPNEFGAVIPDLLSRVEALAEPSGMSARPPVPQRTNDAVPGGRRVRLRYSVNDQSLSAMLAWVDRASQEVPGLYPYSINITPAGQRWTMTVVFARFERI